MPRDSDSRPLGAVIGLSARLYCKYCEPGARAGQRAEFAQSGPMTLAALRAADADPAHGGAAAVRRSATMRQRQRERAEWQPDAEHVNDPGEFRREILPLSQN